ncbi:TetR/AcrR family transcriptional regulator [Allorhizobium pseudoryzae]|jgi:AcrR family transcriptional regulator|uniref:TetR/AcrR family transcriptional regulator n=1 Tax=Allorhizobium pseudoryzae TaxID=379684 RepID=UPI003D05F055
MDERLKTDSGLAGDFSTEALCRRILERHRSTIRVQKTHVAVKKLSLIVDAMLDLSNKQGFHATSLRDLSKASGVSMGGLYSYFDSKTTLLTMILNEVLDTVTRVLGQEPPDMMKDPAAHLGWLIETHIRLTEVMQPWFVFAYMEAKSFPEPARRMAVDSEAATEKIFADVLKRGAAAGHFRIEGPDLAAALIKPLLQDWYVKRAKYRKRGTSIEQYIAAVRQLLASAFEASPR